MTKKLFILLISCISYLSFATITENNSDVISLTKTDKSTSEIGKDETYHSSTTTLLNNSFTTCYVLNEKFIYSSTFNYVTTRDESVAHSEIEYYRERATTATMMDVNISNTTLNTCAATIFDTGGAGGNYGNNQNFTMTICPDSPQNVINLDFISFNIERNFDNLFVYDGNSTAAPLIITLTDNINPADITATNATGCITLRFSSDGSVVRSGFEIDVTCISSCQEIVPISTQATCDNFTLRPIRGTFLSGNEQYFTGPNGTGTAYNAGDVLQFADFPNYPIILYAYDPAIGSCPASEESFNLTIIDNCPPIDVICPADITNACDRTAVDYTVNAIGGSSNNVIVNGEEFTLLTEANGNFYLLSTASLTLDLAFQDAVNRGGTVATVTDAAFNTTLRTAIDAAAGNIQALIGYNDVATEGTFLWQDGSASTYTNWAGTEPNNAGAGEDYTVIRADGLWNDLGVGAPRRYILQINDLILVEQTAGLPSGSIFPAGVTTNTFTARNAAGTTATCSFTVTSETYVVDTLPDVTECDEYVLPVLTTGDYYTQPDGGGLQLQPGDLIDNQGTYYIYGVDPNFPNCPGESSFDLTIIGPDITDYDDVFSFNEYTFPTITGINLSGNEAYFTGPNGTGTRYDAGDIILFADFPSYPITLYVYDSVACGNSEESFELVIQQTQFPDLCNDAIPIQPCTNYQGTVGLATAGTPDDPSSFCGSIDNNIWFAYSPSVDGALTLDLAVGSCTRNDGIQAAIYSGSCGNLSNTIACFGNTNAGTTTTLNWQGVAGENYFIMFDGFAGDICDFSFNLTGSTSTTNISTVAQLCDDTPVDLISYFNAFLQTGGSWTPALASGSSIFDPTLDAFGTYTYTFSYEDCFNNTVSDTATIDVMGSVEIDPIMDQDTCDTYTLPIIDGTNLSGNEAYYTQTGGMGTTFTSGDVIDFADFPSYPITIYAYDEQPPLPTTLGTNLNAITGRNDGVFFDIAAIDEVTVQSFDINIAAGFTSEYRVYSKNGSFIGDETNAAAWTLLDTSAAITSTGNNNAEPLGLALNLVIPAGTTRGFYIYSVANNISINYTTVGSNQDTVATNVDLSILSGTGTEDEFSNLVAGGSRGFSGNVIYTNSDVCTDEAAFDLIINEAIIIDDLADQSACGTFILPVIAGTNLSGNQQYYTQSGGSGTAYLENTVLQIGDFATYPTTLYIYDENSGCNDEQSFELIINTQPVADTPVDVTECDSYTLPALTTGNYFTATGGNAGTGTSLNAGDVITTTQTVFVYAESGTTPNCTDENSFVITINDTPVVNAPMDVTECDSYTLPALATGEYFTATGGTGTPLNAGDVITTTQTVFVYAESGTTPNCTNENSFVITINDTPVADAPANVEVCDVYRLPVLTTGNYFTATGGSGTPLNAGDSLTNTQTVFVYAESSTTPNCSDENSFTVTINRSLPVDNPGDVTACDSYTLPALTNGDYFTGNFGTGMALNAGDVITNTININIYSQTGTTPNCETQVSFTVTINDTPVADAPIDVTECDSYTLPALTNGNYLTGINGSGTPLSAGDVILTTQTVYVYAESGTIPNCTDENSFTITINDSPDINNLSDVTNQCDSYTLPTITGTDLTGNESYYDNINGTGTAFTAGDIITFDSATTYPITLYIYDATITSPVCSDEESFEITLLNCNTSLTATASQDTLCSNSTVNTTLTANPSPTTATGIYSYSWSEQGNATVLGTMQTLDVNPTVNTTYEVTVEDSGLPAGFNTTTATVTISVIAAPVADAPVDVTECDSYTLPALTTGNYFTATGGSGSLLNAGDVITTTQTVFVYAESGTTPNCTDENSFIITINSSPVVDAPVDITECDSYTLPVLNTGNYFTAAGGAGTQLNAGDIVTTTQTVFVYAETGTMPNCTDENSFIITINNTPVVDAPVDITACDNYTLPALTTGSYFTATGGTGTALNAGDVITNTQTLFVYAESGTSPNCTDENSFVITINDTPVADAPLDVTQCDSYALPALNTGNYFTATGGNVGAGIPLNAGDVISTTQTVFVYAESGTTPNCADENSFIITINNTPVADAPVDITACDNYILPALINGNYFTATGGSGTPLNAGDVITTTQTVFVYAETGTTPNCTDENSFVITINNTPVADAPVNVTQCDSYTLPALTTGNYFTATGGNAGTGIPLNAGDVLSTTQTVFVYAESGTTPNCTDENSFVITINNTPVLDTMTDVVVCDSYVLPAITGSNLTGNARYYTSPAGNGNAFAEADTIQFSDFSNYPVTLYVYDETATLPNCSDEVTFTLTINENPPAVAIGTQDFCDQDRDGLESIDLTQYDVQINNGFTPVAVSYYSSAGDAQSGNGNSLNNPYEIFLGSETIFVRSENTNTGCFNTTSFTITLSDVPDPVLDLEYTICLDKNLNVTRSPELDTGLNAAGLTFEWLVDTGNGDMIITGATGPTLLPTEPGMYSVIVTNNATGCTEVTVTDVLESVDPINFGAANSGSNRLNDHSITAFIVGNNDQTAYEIRLDDGNWIPLTRSRDRFTYTFNEVLTGDGLHTVLYRSTNGCWEASVEVRTIGVPQFFTPNNDGFHDSWNIPSMRDLDPNAVISIFDRNGKLMKQISVSGVGWDGMFNGRFLNESDYWFKMEYLDENGAGERFSNTLDGHFSLKR